MKNLTLTMLLILMCFEHLLCAQTFEYILKDSLDSEGKTVCEIGDSYVIGGTVERVSRSSTYGHLLGMNQKGDTLWTRRLTGKEEGRDAIVDLAYFTDNEFVILGEINDEVMISLTNLDGSERWRYTDSFVEEPIGITKTGDDELIIICGHCKSEDGSRSSCAIKLDAEGELIWKMVIGKGRKTKPYAISSTTAGGILVTIRDREMDEMKLILLDKTGELQWEKSVSQYGFEYAFDMNVRADGNIYLTGDLAGRKLPLLVKLDADGNLIWKQEYEGKSGYFRAYAVALTSDGGCILTGRTTDAKGFLLKTDEKGVKEWLRIFDGAEKAGFSDVIELKSGGYLAVGTTMAERRLFTYVVQTDKEGNL